MRRFLVLVAIVAAACPAIDAAEEQGRAAQAVVFDGERLSLAYEAAQSGQTLREFLPRGEKLASWTKLAAIREYPNLDDPMELAAQTLRQLKQDYPLSPSSIIQNPRTQEVIVDFVVWPRNAAFVEFNIFKYQKRPQGGLTTQQYALRAYRDQEAFLKGLRPVRERLVELMADKGLEPAGPGAPRQQQTGRTSP